MNHQLYSKLMQVIIASGLPESVVIDTVVQLAEDLVTDKKELDDSVALRNELAALIPFTRIGG